MSALSAVRSVSASMVALRLVSPALVELITPRSADLSDEVMTLEAVILPERSVRVVRRRLTSQSPKALRPARVTVPVPLEAEGAAEDLAGAYAAQTPLPARPTQVRLPRPS